MGEDQREQTEGCEEWTESYTPLPTRGFTNQGTLSVRPAHNRRRPYVERLYSLAQVARICNVKIDTIIRLGTELDTFGAPLLPERFLSPENNRRYYSANQIVQAMLLARFKNINDIPGYHGPRAYTRDRLLYNLRMRQAAKQGQEELAKLAGRRMESAAEKAMERLLEREAKLARVREAQRLIVLPPDNKRRILCLSELSKTDKRLFPMALWGKEAWRHPAVDGYTPKEAEGEEDDEAGGAEQTVYPWTEEGFNNVVFGDPVPEGTGGEQAAEAQREAGRLEKELRRMATELEREIAAIKRLPETTAGSDEYEEFDEEEEA